MTYRHNKCRFLAAILIICLFSGAFSLPVTAMEVSEAAPAEDRVGAAYLCNLENNLLLYEKNGDTPVYPAASVKIMTGLLACRALSHRLDETVTVTSAMLAGSAGRSMGLRDGEILTVKDLLHAVLCGGYNDAACVLAYLTSGSVAAFVEDMNAEAERLGASSTVYTNPTGLHDSNMKTTAADTARVAGAAWKNPLFMETSSTTRYTIPATNLSEERFFVNRNALISDTSYTYHNGYCRGMSAGMIDEAMIGPNGWCVVTVWEKNGVSNLVVVLEGADVESGETIPAYRYANRLLAWAERNYGYQTVLTAGSALGEYPVAMTGTGMSKTDVVVPHDVALYLPKGADVKKDLTFDIILDGEGLTAPLTDGTRVGTVRISYLGEAVGTAPLTVTESFVRSGFLEAMQSFKSYLTSRAFISTVAAFLILVLLYLRRVGGPRRRYGHSTVKRKSATYKRRYRP